MSELFAVLEATWPAASQQKVGGWLVRQGLGGGRRVSSATAIAPNAADSIDAAASAHAALGQPALFSVRDDQADLDAVLEERGYWVTDPSLLFEADARSIHGEGPARLSSFAIWPPLAITDEIWDEGKIGPERRAVMARVTGPKTAILGRVEDRAAGAAFVATHGSVAMVHAVHVAPQLRGKGLGRNLMRAAAGWALDQGADKLALAVAATNQAACDLYRSMDMAEVGRYHYRTK
ncbi:MAG: GNAT family N-acetyltransferase [Paracoccaceae bacterium]